MNENKNGMAELNESKLKNDESQGFSQSIIRYRNPIYVALTVLIIFVAIAGIVDSYQQLQSTPTDEEIVESLKPLGHLTTVRVNAAQINVEIDMTGHAICRYNAKYLIRGTIEAGVDLTDFSSSDISFSSIDEVYTLKLPKPQLTNCDFQPAHRYHIKSHICPVNGEDLKEIVVFTSQNRIIDDVEQGGILARAERETSIVMENVVTNLTGYPVVVEFQAPTTEPPLPTKCDPEKPRNWEPRQDGKTWIISN